MHEVKGLFDGMMEYINALYRNSFLKPVVCACKNFLFVLQMGENKSPQAKYILNETALSLRGFFGLCLPQTFEND